MNILKYKFSGGNSSTKILQFCCFRKYNLHSFAMVMVNLIVVYVISGLSPTLNLM